MRDFNFLASPGHPGKPLPPNARSHDPAEKTFAGSIFPWTLQRQSLQIPQKFKAARFPGFRGKAAPQNAIQAVFRGTAE